MIREKDPEEAYAEVINTTTQKTEELGKTK